MSVPISRVLEFGWAEPEETAAEMLRSLRYHTDPSDLAVDLTARHPDIVVVDVRPTSVYETSHIPGALSFPHRDMNEESAKALDPSKVYVVYCDGIGCNGSTKGAYKLASLGFKVKELLGGFEWWCREGYATASGPERSTLSQEKRRVSTP